MSLSLLGPWYWHTGCRLQLYRPFHTPGILITVILCCLLTNKFSHESKQLLHHNSTNNLFVELTQTSTVEVLALLFVIFINSIKFGRGIQRLEINLLTFLLFSAPSRSLRHHLYTAPTPPLPLPQPPEGPTRGGADLAGAGGGAGPCPPSSSLLWGEGWGWPTKRTSTVLVSGTLRNPCCSHNSLE